MKKLFNLILLTFFWYEISNAYKVLVVFPVPTKSHSILGDGIVNYLLEAGHEITYITPFPRKNPSPKLHQVEVSSDPNTDLFSLQKILDRDVDIRTGSSLMLLLHSVSGATISDVNVQKLINDPNQQFDAVIAEWLFTELYSGLAAVFDCPFIWSSSMDPHWAILSQIDSIPNPAYTPGLMSPNLPPFNFVQRLQELLNIIKILFQKRVYFTDYENKDYIKWLGPAIRNRGRSVPSYEQVKYNVSLVLGNSHPALGQPIALPQNYVSIGGYHIDTNIKPLPEDIKNLMDNAKDGVIYFSMGTNLKSKDFPDILKKSLLKMLGQLKQTIIWKFEEVLHDVPENVHILKWAPQQSILSHPNCKLIITHSGLLSTTEALHFGVPIVGIPVFADQFTNIDRAVSKGYAKRVDLSYNLADDLLLAVNDVLENSRYAEKVKELSFVYHDRPISPGKELVHWVEHVVRTRGALHLRSPALMIPWYQKMYLDFSALIVIIIFCIIKAIKNILSSSKKVHIKKKNN